MGSVSQEWVCVSLLFLSIVLQSPSWVLAMVTIAAGSVEEVAVAGGVDARAVAVMVAVGAVVEDQEDLVAVGFFNPHQDLLLGE
ncbi:hypothetical protein RHMOL_Rhmol03G0220100 [Rhododendron molle]|uniref:Uncharacterized protein n=1 Tax=Rhododendron molle TaxID=49168 RepID=A0ACC0PHJ8_RHOML|nr:hypothetical protein RHMOL_Rhmol03G0220100 [Rhododendron molle]